MFLFRKTPMVSIDEVSLSSDDSILSAESIGSAKSLALEFEAGKSESVEITKPNKRRLSVGFALGALKTVPDKQISAPIPKPILKPISRNNSEPILEPLVIPVAKPTVPIAEKTLPVAEKTIPAAIATTIAPIIAPTIATHQQSNSPMVSTIASAIAKNRESIKIDDNKINLEKEAFTVADIPPFNPDSRESYLIKKDGVKDQSAANQWQSAAIADIKDW